MKNVSFFAFLVVFALMVSLGVISAEYVDAAAVTETVLKEESVTPADLEVAEPTFLPTSPFYFFKNFTRGVQKFFTFNPVRKIELELKFADEKIAETKKVAETTPERTEAVERAIENYQKSQENLKARLSSLRETSQNPNVDRLLEKVADRAVKHEKLFEELKEKFAAKKELKEKFETTKAGVEESLIEAAKKDDAEKFARKLEKALVETKGSDLKHIRSLEFLDRVHNKAGDELKDKITEIRTDFSKRLNEDIKEFVDKHQTEAPEAVKEVLEGLPGDKARRLIIIEEIQDLAEKRVKDVLKNAEKVLEKVFEEREDIEKRAAEVLEHAQNTLLKLDEKMREVKNIPQSVIRLSENARAHLNEARQAFEAKKFGEAFGQARSAEVLARNALRILEDVEEPEDEDLKEDIDEAEARLHGWEQRLQKLSEELRAKAKDALENARLHLRLAAETLAKGNVQEAKKHLEEAKRFERLLERIFKELFRRHEGEEKPAAAAASPIRPAEEPRSRCADKERSLVELKEMLGLGKISREDFDRKYEILQKELNICLRESRTPTPVPTPETTRTEGEIKPMPIVCTQEYNPVCGVNGKTYSNSCHAKSARVEIKYRGECGKPLEEPATKTGPESTTAPSSAPTKEPAIAAPPPSTRAEPVWLKIEADDNGFYPQNFISVPKGSRVNLSFVVRSNDVYFGGLDFRSSKFKTETVKPGGAAQVEFTADEPFTITSYWPVSERRKADLRVEIK